MGTMEEKSKDVAELLKVMANQNRLLILCALVDKSLNVTELMSYVPNITQSSLSQHLSNLKSHGIVDFEKNGQIVTYSIKDKRVIEIMDVIKNNYC